MVARFAGSMAVGRDWTARLPFCRAIVEMFSRNPGSCNAGGIGSRARHSAGSPGKFPWSTGGQWKDAGLFVRQVKDSSCAPCHGEAWPAAEVQGHAQSHCLEQNYSSPTRRSRETHAEPSPPNLYELSQNQRRDGFPKSAYAAQVTSRWRTTPWLHS